MSDTDTAGTVRFDRPRVEEKVVGTMTQSDMLNMQTREINLREELLMSKNETGLAKAAEALATAELSLRNSDIAVLQAKNADLEAKVALGQVVPAPVPVAPPVVLQ